MPNIWTKILVDKFERDKDLKVVDGLVELLKRRGRLKQLKEILADLKFIQDQADRVGSAKLVLAQPIEEKTLALIKTKLARRLGWRDLNPRIRVDKNLVAGGFLLTRAKFVDFSFRGLILRGLVKEQ